jgi:benzoylformate decarboxylase
MDLVGPEIDYTGLARALGVQAHRVEAPDQVTEAVAAAIRTGQPTLIEVPIDRAIGEDRR